MGKLNALNDSKRGELLNVNTEQENLDYKLILYGLAEGGEGGGGKWVSCCVALWAVISFNNRYN
ncbi:hypothetical protein C5S35_17610 [Candidatus Methanophagaceae archaeon]|nr:hypothetical protein C5S35_17610 [Methanophagales archaeon]